MLENRLDDTLLFDAKTCLQYNKATVYDSTSDQATEDNDYLELLNHKANFKNNNSKRRLVL